MLIKIKSVDFSINSIQCFARQERNEERTGFSPNIKLVSWQQNTLKAFFIKKKSATQFNSREAKFTYN